MALDFLLFTLALPILFQLAISTLIPTSEEFQGIFQWLRGRQDGKDILGHLGILLFCVYQASLLKEVLGTMIHSNKEKLNN